MAREVVENLFEAAQSTAEKIRQEVNRCMDADPDQLNLTVDTLLMEGNILLEGPVGIGKTLLARTIATALGGKFGRVQGTDDVQAADFIGVEIYNPTTGEFSFRKGPLHNNVVLADEFNRNPKKSQGAVFEALEERQTTVGGVTYLLPRPHIVIATQNSVVSGSRHQIDEGGLDRFATGFSLEPFSVDKLKAAYYKKQQGNEPRAVTSPDEVMSAIQEVKTIETPDEVITEAAKLVDAVRRNAWVKAEASALNGPRPMIALLGIAKSIALRNNRRTVEKAYVTDAATAVLSHRIVMTQDAKIDEGLSPRQIVAQVLNGK